MVNIYGVIHLLDDVCIATMVVVSNYLVTILITYSNAPCVRHLANDVPRPNGQ